MNFVLLGDKVFVQGCAATPNFLLDALAKHGKQSQLRDVQLIHIPTEGPAVYNNPEFEGNQSSRYVFYFEL